MQKHILYKIFAVVLFISVGYSFVPYAIAQTTPSDSKMFIEQLLAQVSALQQQLLTMSGTSAPINSNPKNQMTTAGQNNYGNPNYSSCNILRTLSRGSRGQDVICLQQSLVSKGFLSLDSVTGYFGALTETAVQQFQTANQIVSYGDPQTTGYGSVGVRTRAALFAVTSYQTPSYQAQSDPTQSYANCNFNGNSIPQNVSITAYQDLVAPVGSICVSEIRSCGKGILSGSYQYSSCSATEARSCILDGVTISHNSSYTFYATSSVPYGKYCDSQQYGAQTRTCSNGVLSGSDTYSKTNCTVATGL